MPDISTASIVADFLRYRIESLGNGLTANDYPSSSTRENVPDDLHEAIINLSEKLTNDYKESFNNMPGQLKITEHSTCATFQAVCNELFVDGGISWGRIVAFFSFGGAMCEWRLERSLPRAVREVEELMNAYINTKLNSWILANGGWDGLVDFYKHVPASSLQKPELSNGVWSGKQMVGVATLGILTVGAYFFRS